MDLLGSQPQVGITMQDVIKNTFITQEKSIALIVIAFLLGAFLSFAFAPYRCFPLGFLAPACFMLLIQSMSPKKAGFLGFFFGCGLFSVGIYWINISLHHVVELPLPLSLFFTLLLIAILSLYPAITCYLTNRYFSENKTTQMLFAFPAIWVFSEWLRTFIGAILPGTGFPWLLIGYTQLYSPLKGFAPILSVYGVSFATLIVSGLSVNAYRNHLSSFKLYLHLLTIIIIFIVGAALSMIPWTHATGKPISVALVQGNIPQSLKWSPDYLDSTLKRYMDLSQPYWGKTNLIVWPEAAIPSTLQEVSPFINALDEKAQQTHTDLILGIPVQNPKGEGFYNAIVTLGQKKTIYLQRHLVPFGQYIPFERYLSQLLRFLPIPLPNMEPYLNHQKLLEVTRLKIDPIICYEVIFPQLVHVSDANTSLLLTTANDGWFGQSTALSQHLEMAQFRALELGRPLLFVTNNGITALISPQGNIQSTLPVDIHAVLTGNIQPVSGLTPWMRFGIDPILAILIFALLGARSWRWQFLLKKVLSVQHETTV